MLPRPTPSPMDPTTTPPPALSQATHFDLVDLRVFVNVADASSLTRGADRSCLSLAAVSLRIKNLEEAVGARLLHRTKRGVALTDAGQVFLEHARQVLEQVQRLQAEMRPYSHGARGHVRLFANATAISELLPSVLARFFAVHGSISVDLRERLSVEVVRAVHEEVADVGVISALVRADGLETLPYKKDPLVLVVPEHHPLATQQYVSFADALEWDFVGLDSHSATHTFLQFEFARLGRAVRQRIQVGSFDAMCRMIQANVGIGTMPELVARRLAQSSRVKLLQLTDEWAMRELRICVRSMSGLPSYARELIDFIMQEA